MRSMGRATKAAAFLVLGLLFLAIPYGSSTPVPVKRILILFPFESHMPGFIKYETSLRSTLTVSKDYQFEFYVECMDLNRFPSEHYRNRIIETYREKYSGLKVDLIVAFLCSSLHILAKHGPESFLNVPVILAEQDPRFLSDLSSISLAAVVSGRVDIEGTLVLALRLHPDVRKVFVVTGASGYDEMIEGWAREAFRGFESQVDLQYLSRLPMDELIHRVAKLPEHSLVFYLSVTQDGSGHTFKSPDALSLISRQSNAPIYSIAETYIDSGIVGGHLISYSQLGARTAQAVLHTLAGERPGEVEYYEESGNQYVFDARELKRWGIPEATLPPGSTLIHREFSVWESYRWTILGVLAFMLLQALLITGLLVNLGKRRRAEAAVAASEARYRTVADYTYDWEYWVAPDGSLNHISPSCKRITGYSTQEFIENPSLRHEIIIPEDRQIWDRHKADPRPELESQEIQFRIRTRDGEIRWIAHGCQRVIDRNGHFQGIRASNRDVTERKMAEAKAQQHRDELSHVTRVAALGELTSSLAHELNQPLAAILNYANAAQRFLDGAEPNLSRAIEALQGIIRDDKRAAEVIRRVRALLRKQEPQYGELETNNVIREFLDLFQGDTISKGLSVVTELAPDLPAVRADGVQLQQVLINLTLNAADAMSRVMLDSPRLVFRTGIWENQGVKVSVRDFGAGIDENHKDRYFEPFYTTKPEGMGMGLAICRNIIDAHGGVIWAENNPDGGATFYFTLQAAGGSAEGAQK
jgi:PAS domain S-box-containing protein